jgi:hypothetical protein
VQGRHRSGLLMPSRWPACLPVSQGPRAAQGLGQPVRPRWTPPLPWCALALSCHAMPLTPDRFKRIILARSMLSDHMLSTGYVPALRQVLSQLRQAQAHPQPDPQPPQQPNSGDRLLA